MSRKHRSFPYLSFLYFAIAKKRIDTITVIAQLCRKRHANRYRDSLSQRTRGSIDPWRMLYTWMSLQMRTYMTQCRQIFYREKPSICQHGIQARSRVSFGQYKTVTICFFWLLRINIHFFKIKICKYVSR